MRPGTRATVGGAFVACALLAVAVFARRVPAAKTAAVAPADRWSQFRGSLQLTGVSEATLPNAPKLLWTYEAGDAIESSAAIVDGVVYVGSATGELHAINLSDGTPRWKYKASAIGIGESSPAIANGIVYIGDLDGVVHAIDVSTARRGGRSRRARR